MQSVRIERNLDPVFRAQLKGTTEAINSTAGYKGVLVLNTDTNHLHVLTGEAGSSIELASTGDAIDITKVTNLQPILDSKAETDWVQNQLNSKADTTAIADMLTNTEAKQAYLGIKDKAESSKYADSVAWSNVTGTEKVRTTDTPLTLKDFDSLDLGMIS